METWGALLFRRQNLSCHRGSLALLWYLEQFGGPSFGAGSPLPLAGIAGDLHRISILRYEFTLGKPVQPMRGRDAEDFATFGCHPYLSTFRHTQSRLEIGRAHV